MQAKLLFLGTGGDIFVVGKQHRTSGGIILTVDSDQFHIDPGVGSLGMAKSLGVNLRENTAVFLSGNDLLKANDANAVISTMTYDGLDKRGVLVCPSNAVTDSGHDKGPFVNKFYKGCVERVMSLDNTKKIGINSIDIEIIEMKVPISEGCAYRFSTEKFSVGYIPDTQYFTELETAYANTDILIINVLDPRNAKRKEHLNCEDAQRLISATNPQLAILTGFGAKMIQADALYEAREVQKATGIQVISAKDGMMINPFSFATAVRQKSLSGF